MITSKTEFIMIMQSAIDTMKRHESLGYTLSESREMLQQSLDKYKGESDESIPANTSTNTP